jgi:hypothetical protein
VSIWLFANQTDYVGLVPKHVGAFGDITFEVGFVLAALLYAIFFRLQGDSGREEALVLPDGMNVVPAAGPIGPDLTDLPGR